MKKYEFTGETKEFKILSGLVTLHQIQAVRDFDVVKAGNIGGWIEKEANLSHDGNAWVTGNAQVAGNAVVKDDAWVAGNAQVSGNVVVSDRARIKGNAHIYKQAHILSISVLDGDCIAFIRNNQNGISVSYRRFFESIEEFADMIKEDYQDTRYKKIFKRAIKLAKSYIELN